DGSPVKRMYPRWWVGTKVVKSMGVKATTGMVGAVAAGLLATSPAAPAATERYALVVTGASGGSQYAERYQKWRTAFVRTLRESFRYPDDHIVVLAGEEGPGVLTATRENVRKALVDLARRSPNAHL